MIHSPQVIPNDKLTLCAKFDLKVDDIEMMYGIRCLDCFYSFDIRYVGELVTRSESDLLKKKNFGRKSLHEVNCGLAQLGLTLNMNVGDWQPPNERKEGMNPAQPIDSELRVILDKLVDDMDFSVRTHNQLQNARLRYVGEVARLNEKDLKARTYGYRKTGQKTINEIRKDFEKLGLTLGMYVGDWQPPARVVLEPIVQPNRTAFCSNHPGG